MVDPVDTSALGAGATILKAAVALYPTSNNNQENDGFDYLVFVQASQASTSLLTTGDFDACGAVDNPTEGSVWMDMTDDLGTGAYFSWTLNATGMSWIDVQGTTKLGLRLGHDAEDQEPDALNIFQFHNSEQSGTSKDPFLSVNYTPGPPPRRVIIVQ